MLTCILNLLKCFVDFCLCTWFFSWFFESRHRTKLSSFILISGVSCFLLIVNTLGIPWLNTFTTVVCGFLLVELLFKAPFFSSLIATIAVVLISVMCEFFPLMILAMIVDENVSVVLSSPLNSAGFSLISTCCFFCVLRCSRYLLRKKYKSSCIAIDNNGWAILFPFISIIFVYYTIYTDSLVEATRLHTAVHSFLYCAIIISNVLIGLHQQTTKYMESPKNGTLSMVT